MKTEQIIFIDHESEDACPTGGILIDDTYVICGECGSVLELADGEIEIVKRFPVWISISEEIIGE